MKEKVTIIGTLNMEGIFQGVNTPPDWGRQIFAEDYSLFPAGSALRVAFPLSRLGIKSHLIGRVGDDVYGKEILKAIDNSGLSSRGIEKQGDLQTGLCVSLVKEDGQRSLITFLGSVGSTDEELINSHYDLIEKTDILLVTGYFCLAGIKKEAWKRIFQKAKARGTSILLDTGWDTENFQAGAREEILSILPLIDVFLPNIDEAKALSEKNLYEEMTQSFNNAGAGEVIIKFHLN